MTRDLEFVACQKIFCLPISIVDDVTVENDESFRITLGRTSGLDSRITIRPTQGVVTINDNDSVFYSTRDAHINAVLDVYSFLHQLLMCVWKRWSASKSQRMLAE